MSQFGRYETMRTIASGGMATVYLGRVVGEGGFERLVAIKVMHPHIAADPDFQAMFLDEARLAARIRHPNVVSTIDVEKNDNGVFLVMDYVDGPSLHNLRREFSKRKQHIPIPHSLRIFIDALSGLHAAHELSGRDGQPLQLVHRDVTPQNILVGKDGVSRITDFGVARAEARITSTRNGQLKGKLAYMPPEQVQNLPIDRRVDIYACAVSLWEALAGRRLFKADNEAGILMMILQGATEPPSTYNPEVPALIDEVCMKGLSSEPQARYETAADFADALEDAAHSCGIRVSTARKLAAFIKAQPGTLSERPAPMTTTPSNLSVKEHFEQSDGMMGALPQAAASPSNEPSQPSVTAPGAVLVPPATSGSSTRVKLAVVSVALVVTLGVATVLTTSAPTPPEGDSEPTEATPAAAAPAEEAPPAAEPTPSAPPAPSASAEEEPPAPEPKAAPRPTIARPLPRPPPKPPSHTGPGYNPDEL